MAPRLDNIASQESSDRSNWKVVRMVQLLCLPCCVLLLVLLLAKLVEKLFNACFALRQMHGDESTGLLWKSYFQGFR